MKTMIEVKRIEADLINDELIKQLHATFPISDDNQDWDSEMTKKLVGNSNNIFLIGYFDGQIAGFLYGHVLDRFDRKKKFFIYELGTAPAFRQKGVMREIFAYLFEYLKENNIDSLWVLTEKQNTPAMNLYSSLGGEIVDGEIMFNFKVNEE